LEGIDESAHLNDVALIVRVRRLDQERMEELLPAVGAGFMALLG
jgi:hypothetical protein